MKKAVVVLIFSIFVAASAFAEVAENKPNTVFQKVASYSKEGYKEDVKPIKKVTMFQFAADWAKGSAKDEKSASTDKPSLFWK